MHTFDWCHLLTCFFCGLDCVTYLQRCIISSFNWALAQFEFLLESQGLKTVDIVAEECHRFLCQLVVKAQPRANGISLLRELDTLVKFVLKQVERNLEDDHRSDWGHLVVTDTLWLLAGCNARKYVFRSLKLLISLKDQSYLLLECLLLQDVALTVWQFFLGPYGITMQFVYSNSGTDGLLLWFFIIYLQLLCRLLLNLFAWVLPEVLDAIDNVLALFLDEHLVLWTDLIGLPLFSRRMVIVHGELAGPVGSFKFLCKEWAYCLHELQLDFSF